MSVPPQRLGRGPVVAAALGSFALSLLLLPRVPGIGDSAEFTLALALAGVPHPTGYPLYVLAGHAFVVALHAAGVSWVAAANLWSTTGAAVAAGAFTRLAQHLAAAETEAAGAGSAPGRAIAIALPVALLALNPIWIESATVAEVYSWNHAWLAAAAAVAIGRLRRLDRAGAACGAGGGFGWGLLCGLGAAHHASAVLFALPLTLALAAGRARARAGGGAAWLMKALAGALIPFAGVGWIAWRAAHPAAFQWPVEPDAASIWRHVRGAAYSAYLGRFAPSGPEWVLIRAAALPWMLPGLVILALWALRFPGLAVRGGLLALAGGAAVLVAFIVSYGVPDPAMYFVPALMVSMLAAVPVTLALARRVSAPVLAALAAAVGLTLASWSVPRALRERARLAGVDARVRAAWAAVPFERGIVLWRDDHYHRLKVFQLLEGSHPDRYVDSPNALTWRARRTAFERRFGFDPLRGIEPRTAADVDRISAIVRRSAAGPVVEFPELLERQPRVAP